VLEAALDLLDDLGVRLLHVGDALDDLDLLLAGQADEDFAGLLRRQVREDQRDRLRVLVLDERQEVFRFGLLQEAERRGLDLLRDLLDDAVGVASLSDLRQQALGVLKAAFADVGVGQRLVVELIEDVFARREGDLADRGDLARPSSTASGGSRLRISAAWSCSSDRSRIADFRRR
jgi:hypothetical protein